jgi:HK97 family phage portal protein
MQALVSTLSPGARRDISNLSPVPLVPRRRNVFNTYASAGSMLSFLEAYASDPVIRPIVSRLQQSVSEAEWKLYVKSRTGDKQDRTPVASHAALDLLDMPNKFMTFSEIVARGQQHWELVGETSIVLGFQPGIPYPIDMWVLRPDRIAPVPDPYDFLLGWMYTAPGDGEKIPIPSGEMLRMVDPDPLDPYRGMGAVQALIRDLDATRYAKEWQGQFFANSAQPGGVIIADHRLDDTEFEELQVRWAEQHQGISKSHRIALLEDNMKFVQNAFSLKDLQMAELESLGRDKTLAAFGMPKSMIGVVEDVNRANAEAGVFMFARWMTKPRLQGWRAMLNRQLLPYFDPRGQLELDFDDPVPENSDANIAELKTKADVVVELVKAGFHADAVLEMVDWPDLGYDAPAPPVTQSPPPPAPGGQPGEPGGDEGMPAPNQDEPNQGTELRARIQIDSAMRWVVRGHPDDNCCDPCLKKIGTLYRNRSSAYADYPPGEGYIKCIGRQYGNKCRCHVAKRRSDRG